MSQLGCQLHEGIRQHTWSTVARVQSGLRTMRPAFLRPSNACCSKVRIDTEGGGNADHTGDVTSWTRCLSVENVSSTTPAGPLRSYKTAIEVHTDIQENGTVFGLVDNMVTEDLIVQGSRLADNARHGVIRWITKRYDCP